MPISRVPKFDRLGSGYDVGRRAPRCLGEFHIKAISTLAVSDLLLT